MQKAIKLFKIDKFNHVLTATFLVYTSLLCAVYAYLLFQAVHEIENQAAQIYLQNAQVEVLKELNTIELPLSSNLAEDLTSVSDDELIKKLIEHFKQSRPKLRIYSSITANNPEYLSPLTIGFHEYQPEDAQILVSALPERNIKLYLVYDETNASNLDENTPNLIAGLSTVAILICLFGIMVSIALGKKNS